MWRAFIDAMAEWNSVAICGRLALAILTGTVIGIDRGLKRRGARDQDTCISVPWIRFGNADQ